ncbi:MAG: hypothetical protein R2770_10860 [Acidimicrobiales bacterium]|nr:hypothetical protein [Acidimicrobiales bacterium]
MTVDQPSHWLWRERPAAEGPSVCVDLDGVLADGRHREPLLAHGRWDDFFAACGQDVLIGSNALLVALLDPALTVVLLTSRPLTVQQPTVEWVSRHHVRWDLLVMRPSRAQQSSAAFKSGEVDRLRAAGYPPMWAIDDDPRNIDAYRRSGVSATYIHSGIYDRQPGNTKATPGV